MRRLTVIILALLVGASSLAQEKARKPLDVPMSFAGTYGELRHDHFHGGLDWRVGGRVGDTIHAIKSGYISKVTVSPYGYGNGLYITHNDGTMSVYGHMLSFNPDIAARVKEEQYLKESYSVALEFGPDVFPVAQGDAVGRVGNTGSSAGPHLHMEVRDAERNIPLDYLAMGYYKPEDTMQPIFQRVCFYGIDTLGVPYGYKIHDLKAPKPQEITLPAHSYVAIDAVDKQNGTTGRLAVEEYEVLLDGETIFKFKVGDVTFDEGPYIKSLIQYDEAMRGGMDMVKSWVDPHNLMFRKIESKNDGIIVLDDYNPHRLELKASDVFGNVAKLNYTVRRKDYFTKPQVSDSTTVWFWYTPNIAVSEGFSYELQPASLYRSINFSFSKVAESDPAHGIWSPVWRVGDSGTPLHRPGKLHIESQVPEELKDKSYIANYGAKLSYAGENVRFGTYCVAVDTIAPTITFRENKQKQIFDGGMIKARVRDNGCGIESVRTEIDGQWYLSMLKGENLSIILDKDILSKGEHNIKIIATDICGNEAYAERQFSY